MSDFERINAPRVEKVVAMLETINKSARSNRVDDAEIAKLLAPIDAKIEEVWPATSGQADERFEEDPDTVAEYMSALKSHETATPPIRNEMSSFEDLTTQQLVDRMIAAGAVLASRRK